MVWYMTLKTLKAVIPDPLTRLPTTMTDAMISVMQFIDHGKLTSEEIWRYFVAMLFDKNPDKKK